MLLPGQDVRVQIRGRVKRERKKTMKKSTTTRPEGGEKKEKPIPVIRSNRQDVNRMMGIFAAINEFELCQKEMEARIRAIPNGWRDMRLVDVKLTDIINGLVQTFPYEKMVSLRRMMPGMAYKAYYARPAAVDKDETLILQSQLDTLCGYAHEQCKLCVDMHCGVCPLGKVFDAIMSDDRDGRSWAEIDVMREENA